MGTTKPATPSEVTASETPSHNNSVYDVAKLAGVAVVTVSRAFNDSPLVSSATRERVLQAARDLGYRPNSAARALSKGRTNQVGLVFRAEHLFGSFYSELLAGFHSVISRKDLSLLLTVPPEGVALGPWLRQLVGGAALDALVLHYEIVRDAGAELVRALRVPVVVGGLVPNPTPQELSLSALGFDHSLGVQQAIRHLVALGHREIAYLDIPGTWHGPSTRSLAFRREIAEAGLSLREDWIIDCTSDSSALAGSEAIQLIYSGKQPHPTAVVCGSDLIAAGAMHGAAAWGRKVPADLSVVGYGDYRWSEFMFPPMTTVHQRGWDLGVALGESLIARFDGAPEVQGRTALPLRLIVRQSTGPAPVRKQNKKR